jgi:hypothetical protein
LLSDNKRRKERGNISSNIKGKFIKVTLQKTSLGILKLSVQNAKYVVLSVLK